MLIRFFESISMMMINPEWYMGIPDQQMWVLLWSVVAAVLNVFPKEHRLFVVASMYSTV